MVYLRLRERKKRQKYICLKMAGLLEGAILKASVMSEKKKRIKKMAGILYCTKNADNNFIQKLNKQQ